MFDQPTATDAIFELLEDEPWPLRIHVSGQGYVARAVPVAATVGEVVVQHIIPPPEGRGFTGVLAETPDEGAVLKVGWADSELVATAVTFQTGNA